MQVGENILKALFILKKRKDGGLDCYFNKKGNYDDVREFLNPATDFKDWHAVHAGNRYQLEGFCAVQMRPKATLLPGQRGGGFYVDADYSVPFDQWKFNLRHQFFELPDWVCIGEIKKKCLELMPSWAKGHLIYGGSGICSDSQAIVVMGCAEVKQTGGFCWAYGKSIVYQQPGHSCKTNLHDVSIGYVYKNARAETSLKITVRVFNSATLILIPDSKGNLSHFKAYSKTVKIFQVKPGSVVIPNKPILEKDLIPVEFTPQLEPYPFWNPERGGINMPFNMPVD